jgi:hypothetical protein
MYYAIFFKILHKEIGIIYKNASLFLFESSGIVRETYDIEKACAKFHTSADSILLSLCLIPCTVLLHGIVSLNPPLSNCNYQNLNHDSSSVLPVPHFTILLTHIIFETSSLVGDIKGNKQWHS